MELKHTLILAGSLFGISSQAQVLSWADRFVSSSGTAAVTAVTADADGNSYAAGNFTGTVDMDPGSGLSELTAISGYGDGFVAKFDPSGMLLWAKQFATPADGILLFKKMALRPGDGLALTGEFTGSADFDPGSGDHSVAATYIDGFVCALDMNGDLDWVDTWGNGYTTWMDALDVDPDGNIAAIGQFAFNMDIDPGAGVQMTTAGVQGDAFLLRLSGTGSLLWGRQLSASGYSVPTDVALDAAGSAYFVGSAMDTIGSGSVHLSVPSGNNSDAFIIKFDVNGTAQWGYLVGGTGGDTYEAVDANSAGDLVISGTVSGSADIAPGPTVNMVAPFNAEPMLVGLDTDGGLHFSGALSISSDFGNMAKPYAVAIAENGDCSVTGDYVGTLVTDFQGGTTQVMYGFSSYDAFVCKYSSTGGILYSGTVTGDLDNTGRAVAFDGLGNLFLGGSIAGNTDVDPGAPWVSVACTSVQGLLLKLGPGSVGLQSIGTDQAFSLAPNPANDQLRLTFPENAVPARVAVIDAQGRTVRIDPVGGVRSVVLDVHGLSPGVYHLRAEGPHGTSVQRFVKD